MIKKLAVLAALMLVAVPTVSTAQASMVFVNPGTINDGRYFVGPYQVTNDGVLQTVYCVDFFHDVSVDPPSEWTANISDLGGDLSNTRAGNAGLDEYQKAAYLTTLYSGASNQQTIDIQHAIWRLFAPDEAFISSNNDYLIDAGSDYYLALANSSYATSGVDFSVFQVVTDVRVNDPNFQDGVTVQEFLTTTPEPSSMALLGTGLVGLVPMIRRRRKK
jgi:hypothetical protein